MSIDRYAAELERYAAEVSWYAEKIQVVKLFGMQKPRFYGDPVLEGRGKPAPAKCNSCGSHDFVLHQARHICSYCRQ